MISVHTIKRRDDAIALLKQMKIDRPVLSCVPIFADVLLNNEKLGHIVSNGYSQETWSFYPADQNRKPRPDKAFGDVLPKWVSDDAYLGVFENSAEMTEKREAKKKVEYRENLLKDPAYKAIDSDGFPCNPIPFANSLADHVREFGTDSIKTDDAKKILWILMGQAYGQLATIDLSDEWDRLTKRGGTNHGK
jgi:hypothetical protein